MNHPVTSPQRPLRLAAVVVAGTGLLALATGAVPAAAETAAVTDGGWVRVAHLSPDTAKVDVQLSALSGGASVVSLADVGYGIVSDYVRVPLGTYTVSMVPADAPDGAAPALTTSVQIEDDKTVTVAAYGENSDLETRVYQDDLTGPAAGSARIRLVQASSVTESVDVQTTTGVLIADDARAGDATAYATVPAGPWDLELTAEGVDDVSQVVLADGSVNTLFVLDNAEGGLTVKSVLDSAAVGAAPVGGVQTGGGAEALAPGRLATESLR